MQALFTLRHRFHRSLRGRQLTSASWCQVALTDQCWKRFRSFKFQAF